METIRNYLEAMFAQLPDTGEVRQAKEEMLQMMEDRYNGLIAGGMKENEAVGTVITEFGDIDELRESLETGEAEHSAEKNKTAAADHPAEKNRAAAADHSDPARKATVPPYSQARSQGAQPSYQTQPHRDEESEKPKMGYPNLAFEIGMKFYWETIVCLYLIWSFLTFDWGITWIIWPIAAVVHGVMEKSLEIYTERKEEEAESR